MSSDAGYLAEGLRVAALNRRLSEALADSQQEQRRTLETHIQSSEALLARLGVDTSGLQPPSTPADAPRLLRNLPAQKSWGDLLAEAESHAEEVRFEDLLTAEEIRQIHADQDAIGAELDWSGSLTKFDVATALFAGAVAGAIDVFLVGVPKSPGFLGSEPNEGGWLSNLVKEKFGQALPQDEIDRLEKAYKTAYDPSTNRTLKDAVDGLGPRTHRYQSLGHDPLLGFIFGIKDILTGNFTAISKYGEVVTQQVTAPFMPDENFFVRVFEALKLHWGHLKSDVATPAGLPAPLMPLLSFLQFGKIGNKEYSISEVARMMYRSGYDFRHFVATSIPVAISELIVRLGHVIQALHDGKDLKEAIPLASNLTVRRKLIIAHGVATVVNAGKVYVTKNIMGISWAQILVLSRYLVPEIRYLALGKDAEKARMVEEVIWKGYVDIYAQTSRIEASVAGQLLLI